MHKKQNAIPASLVQLLFITIALVGFVLCVPSVRAQPGTPIWTNRYNGPANGIDWATAVSLDRSGHVYIAGYSAGSGTDYLIVAYSNNGIPLWTNRYNRAANSADQANAIAIDPVEGNIYVTGYSTGSGTGNDFTTLAYSSTGIALWTNHYNGPANSTDQAKAIAVNAIGNVYVTGYSTGAGTGNDYATVAYTGAGTALWTNRYNGPANSTDQAIAITVNGTNNVYVTGYSTGSGTGNDYTTIAYSGAGLPLWTNRYNGSGGGTDQGRAIAVDGANNVYVTGRSIGDGTGNDYLTIGYSASGSALWTNRFNGLANSSDVANAVAVGKKGNVYVTGFSRGAAINSEDFATIALASNGEILWVKLFDGPGNDSDSGNAVGVDGGGTVIVAGRSWNGTSEDIAVVAYTEAGIESWSNQYSGPANSFDVGIAIAVDERGNSFVVGPSEGIASSDDFVVIKYAGTGDADALPIPLSIEIIEAQLILSWTNPAFILQSAPTISGGYTNVPNGTSPHTNHVSNRQEFFRLWRN